MSDIKEIVYLTNQGGLPCGNFPMNELIPYHHSRIVTALQEENERISKERDELKRMLCFFKSRCHDLETMSENP